ncbi:hypothetical protein BU24DRAFT_494258 [Aaosphaeria arxii CBS 175.79]|uniref:Uncharacterized protein n=1 Tax=Aaosphaeria arxii CBS 175.79 TaxID=1450172 RepID=A0A6A5XLW9_9PLEO|nr:uncharacterized protein BU24DRAFT_494258 [Aaosphaeria arxii CBS 175.79]KAF2013869.1 hypothetical protein BU24DRAFT_494258 [Aaosphaeria arxii CBS 175.79]
MDQIEEARPEEARLEEAKVGEAETEEARLEKARLADVANIEASLVQGRILWLPPQEQLFGKEVKRAHGKGPIDEGIYNHPVVVVSRPKDQDHIVHFQIITSFQGKDLGQKYDKDTEYHLSRRSWYLPIYPSPDHPDIDSKKSRKKYPTLELAQGAVLRGNSYVKIRSIYKIDWRLLKPYDAASECNYRFNRSTVTTLLAKTKLLTEYTPGTQYEGPRSRQRNKNKAREVSPNPEAEASGTHLQSQQDFWVSKKESRRCHCRPPKAPPDIMHSNREGMSPGLDLCRVVGWLGGGQGSPCCDIGVPYVAPIRC